MRPRMPRAAFSAMAVVSNDTCELLLPRKIRTPSTLPNSSNRLLTTCSVTLPCTDPTHNSLHGGPIRNSTRGALPPRPRNNVVPSSSRLARTDEVRERSLTSAVQPAEKESRRM
eukprot:CAMPEP_0173077120 /NCGR_PEP_ID=MMETSP1102-20130122/12972_1 /TAXON_ID=49646 /ORGANISM="Geminigera sp., Strain Caron Lab Isolate" /LENGTH=113 /DNA_ID=CAMNT_0013947417 /DNA_START=806 /DNA_END=1147 /DNA_ORIENTATION=+